ncbi:hypothetical protein Cob_v010697 [Colletotrichum orbiculare MAFF 240422]|uniref:Secreted protein n=1 Tax=Colletotrichum orbiculare (strain 104-T / ATCC 96160 / CBS 514.97 / LARS 414 / MAFF 240422) TaxID=1213857 RepID=A0A484FHN0_COLOR|nr:hypothetical protein Cob_v010697 [Colletotrichum orbiculare MAFF 240422]
MKFSLTFLFATSLLGINVQAVRQNCWCTVDGDFNTFYTKKACYKFRKYTNHDYRQRTECKLPSDKVNDDWSDKCLFVGATGGECRDR